jgi:hypothetical protein
MHSQTTTHLMIAGSRYASRAMLDYARRAVRRAHQLGWTILVGDNPKGVDMAVVNECRRLKAKVIVVALTHRPRNGGCAHGQYVRFERGVYHTAGGGMFDRYHERDRYLVDQCDRAVFVWNGNSRGTKRGYDYAIQRGKTTHLVNFDRRPQP